jgi:hypothetical protein
MGKRKSEQWTQVPKNGSTLVRCSCFAWVEIEADAWYKVCQQCSTLAFRSLDIMRGESPFIYQPY